jgi:MoxR-like ATPase
MEITQTAVRDRIVRLLAGLCEGLYEREEPVRLALLTALAGESIFLLGPPGVGKSLIARRLKYAFRDGASFEYLMSRFSTPDELFGPVSIKKLKEEDKYERLTDKYLPGANIVFLDEIWKAGPAIQNALLTILNEKVYRNGEQEVVVDIKVIITASNELPPAQESFQPLWDRLLVRLPMEGVRDNRSFLRMITDTRDVYEDPVPNELKFSAADLEIWHAAIDEVEVPPEVLNTIQIIRYKLEETIQNPPKDCPPVRVYDRRWKKLIRLLRTAAYLNGREKVDLMDCFLAVNCLWTSPDQIPLIQDIVGEAIRKHGYSVAVNLGMIRKEVETFADEVDQEIRVRHVVTEDVLLRVKERYYEFLPQEKPFQGELLLIEEFDKLQQEEYQTINLFDRDENLRLRLKARISKRENHIDVVFNSVEASYPLQTRKKERRETLTRKPHPLLVKHWDERFADLLAYIQRQEARLQEESPEEFRGLEENLFVPAAQAALVKANLREVAEALRQLRLMLEKARFGYASLMG